MPGVDRVSGVIVDPEPLSFSITEPKRFQVRFGSQFTGLRPLRQCDRNGAPSRIFQRIKVRQEEALRYPTER